MRAAMRNKSLFFGLRVEYVLYAGGSKWFNSERFCLCNIPTSPLLVMITRVQDPRHNIIQILVLLVLLNIIGLKHMCIIERLKPGKGRMYYCFKHHVK